MLGSVERIWDLSSWISKCWKWSEKWNWFSKFNDIHKFHFFSNFTQKTHIFKILRYSQISLFSNFTQKCLIFKIRDLSSNSNFQKNEPKNVFKNSLVFEWNLYKNDDDQHINKSISNTSGRVEKFERNVSPMLTT